MKTYTISILILLFTVVSCDEAFLLLEDENIEVCGVKDPLANLSWLRIQLEEMKGGADINGIVLYLYEGKEVIEVQNSLFSSTNNHQYYCDGTKLDLTDPDDFNRFRRERIEIGMLYGTKIWGD